MILNFTSKIQSGPLKGQETNFVEKIKSGTKIHTIREDSKDRWKIGNKIHFCAGGYQKPGRIFQEGTANWICPIKITWTHQENEQSKVEIEIIDNGFKSIFTAFLFGLNFSFDEWLKGKVFFFYAQEEISLLARNDGFDRVEDFLRYFNKDFVGKIICWDNKNTASIYQNYFGQQIRKESPRIIIAGNPFIGHSCSNIIPNQIQTVPIINIPKICQVEGCRKPVLKSNGIIYVCRKHYEGMKPRKSTKVGRNERCASCGLKNKKCKCEK